jgi:hypothetical protein
MEEKMHKICIKNETKFWYIKSHNPNKTLYNLYIQNGKKANLKSIS